MSDANELKRIRQQEVQKPPPPEMFLRNSIERILNDRDIKKKDHAQLKQSCESALG